MSALLAENPDMTALELVEALSAHEIKASPATVKRDRKVLLGE